MRQGAACTSYDKRGDIKYFLLVVRINYGITLLCITEINVVMDVLRVALSMMTLISRLGCS